ALAREKRGVILFKSHVMMIAAPDGRLAVVDGMRAGLSVGGSGDLLAGLCAGIAARLRRNAARTQDTAALRDGDTRDSAARGGDDTRDSAVRGGATGGRAAPGPDQTKQTEQTDLYACAVAGASLLIRAAEDPRLARRFADPLEFADIAADLAGRAWLPAPGRETQEEGDG
ncbi:MAG: hypothetical protein LBH51_10195, partial [Treponema sp.]|nr:hypothetical protein [Treponema sp.]